MKRFEQISQTLPANLEDNKCNFFNIEFVLVDFIIKDDYRLFEFVYTDLRKYLESGYLRYFHTTDLKYFHSSVCKNTSHRLSSGDILTNLDADNYTGKNGGNIIIDIFKQEGKNVFLHQGSDNINRKGSAGRITYYRNDFFNAGGYDERFLPCGHEDRDIMKRLIGMGKRKINFDNEKYNKAIKNSRSEATKNIQIDMDYTEMVQYNKSKSLENIAGGNLIANQEKEFIGVYPFKKSSYFTHLMSSIKNQKMANATKSIMNSIRTEIRTRIET